MVIHGFPDQAHAIVADIERSAANGRDAAPQGGWARIRLQMRHHTPLAEVARTLFSTYRQRSVVALVLMFVLKGRNTPAHEIIPPTLRAGKLPWEGSTACKGGPQQSRDEIRTK